MVPKQIAFLFPGQGSQSIGMLRDLNDEYSIVQDTFEVASQVLGYDLFALIQNGPSSELDQTIHTQPALLAAGVTIWRIWQEQRGIAPVLMAGHSLGEYTALVCANALEFSTAVELVAERGRLMQEAVPEGLGAMAAIIGLSTAQVEELCRIAKGNSDEVLSPANYNAEGQIVIAGHTTAIERALGLAKEHGAKLAKRLPVSVPSHCSLMKHAAEQLALRLATISLQTPEIPVINNVDVAFPSDPSAIKDALIRQLYRPVRWVELMNRVASESIELAVEAGPGKVLTGLNKRIDPAVLTLAVYDPASLQEALMVTSELK